MERSGAGTEVELTVPAPVAYAGSTFAADSAPSDDARASTPP